MPFQANGDSQQQPPHQPLKSASELDYPPFSLIREDGTPDGFSVDLLKAVVQTLGLEIQFRVGPWHEIKQQLIDGELDVLPLVSYSKERDEVLDFTSPYLRMHGTIFVRKGEKSIRTSSDLKGREVLTMRGDTANEYAVRNKLTDKLILTESFEEALKKLSAGEHDAVFMQHLVGLQLIKQMNITNVVSVDSFPDADLKPTAKPLSGFEQKFCFAVPEGRRRLLAQLNEGLAVVITNGSYDALYEKWFGPILPKARINTLTLVRYLITILLPLLLLIFIINFWYMRKEINRKTAHLTKEISERRQAEKALKESEEKFRLAIEATTDGLWDWNVETDAVFYSQRWLDILSEDAVQPVHETWADRIHPDDKADVIASVYSHLSGETDFWRKEHRLQDKNDQWKWVLGRGRVVKRNSQGQPVRMIGTMTDISERKQAEEKLDAAFKERGVLLQEIHHRVKNNLQIINSLINMQLGELKDEASSQLLKDTQSRILAMASVHDSLYQSTTLSKIVLIPYLRGLWSTIARTYGSVAGMHISGDKLELSIEQCIPIGLVVNEILTNAHKYAFTGDREEVSRIRVEKTSGNKICITISDYGKGLPEDIDWRNAPTLGLKLIVSLVEYQLDGTVELDRSNGTTFIIRFPEGHRQD